MIASIQEGQETKEGNYREPDKYDDSELRNIIAQLQEQMGGIGSIAPPPPTRAPRRVSGIEAMVSPRVLRGGGRRRN